MSSIKRICLVRLSALGDVILMVPLLRTLQRALPNVRLTWVTSPITYTLLADLPSIEFIIIDKPRSLADYWRFKKRMASERFDVLLAMQASLRANLLYPCINAKRKIGFDKARAKDGHSFFVRETVAARREHLLEGFLAFATKLGITDHIIDWQLPISKQAMTWAQQLVGDKKPVLALQLAASKQERCWPIVHYIQVIKKMVQRYGVHIVLIGGPNPFELGLASEIVKQVDVSLTNVVGQINVMQLAALLSQVNALLAPDSGPAHLATAVGTPVVGLYAVAPAELSGPYLWQHLVIDRYPEAVRQILKRDPKAIPWGTRVHTERAMELIPVADVMSQLQKVFEG